MVGALLCSISVPPVLDAQDDDLPAVLVDPGENSVRAAPGGQNTGEITSYLLADAARLFRKSPCDELDQRQDGQCLFKFWQVFWAQDHRCGPPVAG